MSNRFRKSQLLSMPLIAMISLNSQVSISAESTENKNTIEENVFGLKDVNFTVVSSQTDAGYVGCNETNSELKYLTNCIINQLNNITEYVELYKQDADIVSTSYTNVLNSMIMDTYAYEQVKQIQIKNKDIAIDTNVMQKYATFMSKAFNRCLTDNPSSYIARLMQVLIALDTKLLNDDKDGWRNIDEAKEYLAEFLYVSDMALNELQKSPTLDDEPSMMLLSIMLNGTAESKDNDNGLDLNPFEISSDTMVGIKDVSDIITNLTKAITALRTGVKDVISNMSSQETNIVTTSTTKSMMANDVYKHLSEKYTIGADKVSFVKQAIGTELQNEKLNIQDLATSYTSDALIQMVSDKIDMNILLGDMIQDKDIEGLLGMNEFNKISTKISEQLTQDQELNLMIVIEKIKEEAEKHTSMIKDKRKLLIDIINDIDYTALINKNSISTPDSKNQEKEITTTLKLAINGFSTNLKVDNEALNEIAYLKALYEAGREKYNDFRLVRKTSVFKEGFELNNIDEEVYRYNSMNGFELWLARYEAYGTASSITNDALKGALSEEEKNAAKELEIDNVLTTLENEETMKAEVTAKYNQHYKEPKAEARPNNDWLLSLDDNDLETVLEQYGKEEKAAIDALKLTKEQKRAKRSLVDQMIINMRNSGANVNVNDQGDEVINTLDISTEENLKFAKEMRQEGLLITRIIDNKGKERIIYIPDPKDYKIAPSIGSETPKKDPIVITKVIGNNAKKIQELVSKYIPKSGEADETNDVKEVITMTEIHKKDNKKNVLKQSKNKQIETKKETPNPNDNKGVPDDTGTDNKGAEPKLKITLGNDPFMTKKQNKKAAKGGDDNILTNIAKQKLKEIKENDKPEDKKPKLKIKQLAEIPMDKLIEAELHGVLPTNAERKENVIKDSRAVLIAYKLLKDGTDNFKTKDQLKEKIAEILKNGFEIANYKVIFNSSESVDNYITSGAITNDEDVTNNLLWKIADGKISFESIAQIERPAAQDKTDIKVDANNLLKVISYKDNGTPKNANGERLTDLLGEVTLDQQKDKIDMMIYTQMKLKRYVLKEIATTTGTKEIVTTTGGNVVLAQGGELITREDVDGIEQRISARIKKSGDANERLITLISKDLDEKDNTEENDDNNKPEGNDDENNKNKQPLNQELQKIKSTSTLDELEAMLKDREVTEIQDNKVAIVQALNKFNTYKGNEEDIKLNGQKILDISSHLEYLKADDKSNMNTIIDGKIHIGELEKDELIKICKGQIDALIEEENNNPTGNIGAIVEIEQIIESNDSTLLQEKVIQSGITDAVKTYLGTVDSTTFNKGLRNILIAINNVGGIANHQMTDNDLGKTFLEKQIAYQSEWIVDNDKKVMMTGTDDYDLVINIPPKPKIKGELMMDGKILRQADDSDIASEIVIKGTDDYKINNDTLVSSALYMTKELGELGSIDDIKKTEVKVEHEPGTGANITITLGSKTIKIELLSNKFKATEATKLKSALEKVIKYNILGDRKMIVNNKDRNQLTKIITGKSKE